MEAVGRQFSGRLPDNDEAGLVRWTDCHQLAKLREAHGVLTNELTVAGGALMQPFGVTEYKIPPGPDYTE